MKHNISSSLMCQDATNPSPVILRRAQNPHLASYCHSSPRSESAPCLLLSFFAALRIRTLPPIVILRRAQNPHLASYCHSSPRSESAPCLLLSFFAALRIR